MKYLNNKIRKLMKFRKNFLCKNYTYYNLLNTTRIFYFIPINFYNLNFTFKETFFFLDVINIIGRIVTELVLRSPKQISIGNLKKITR